MSRQTATNDWDKTASRAVKPYLKAWGLSFLLQSVGMLECLEDFTGLVSTIFGRFHWPVIVFPYLLSTKFGRIYRPVMSGCLEYAAWMTTSRGQWNLTNIGSHFMTKPFVIVQLVLSGGQRGSQILKQKWADSTQVIEDSTPCSGRQHPLSGQTATPCCGRQHKMSGRQHPMSW